MSQKGKSGRSGAGVSTPNGGGSAARLIAFGLANRDIVFATAVILILGMLFVPLPPVILDLGLAVSLSVSILILMVSLWIARPLDFNSFPTVLLVITMMRLSLNVASTRLILSEGHTGPDAAGGVIQGFAQFIVGGNFVIGAVIFIILVIINFIVITKGSTRIAEVSARFYLDGMPGKQMAIDADLGAGLIDETEARRRRKELEDESSFYGAMDGASKFVRGDAVAGLIITGINIVGGILIGLLQHGMSFTDAAGNYTTLTIGDGLVSQIPALVVSLAAGLIVTKGGTVGAANEAVISQLGGFPKALYMAAVLLFAIGLLPDFPVVIFTSLAASMAGLGWLIQREAADGVRRKAEAAAEPEKERPRTAEEELREAMRIDPISLELGAALVPMIGRMDATLPSKVRGLRQMFARDYGFVLPAMRIRDEPTVASNFYIIRINGVEVAKGEMRGTGMMVILPAEGGPAVTGERAKDPTFGLDVVWVDAEQGAELEKLGLTVVDPENVVITHLTEVIRDHMPDFMTWSAAQALIADLDDDYRKLAGDLPGGASIALVQNVLQRLLAERVSIRNLPMIVEAISESSRSNGNIDFIAEHVRRRLGGQICESLTDRNGFIPVMTLSNGWEAEFNGALRMENGVPGLMLSPQRVQDFVLEARQLIQRFARDDQWPAILVTPEVRRHVRAMLERVSPMTPVISHAEIHRKASIRTVSTIGR
jgi:flagellar biosynthesis protein FlhA